LTVRAGRADLPEPFRYDPLESPTVDGASDWEEAKRELVRRMREATRVRLVSDVPLGCFLSGGVDSSTVLSFMAELSSRPVKTFSIGFPEAEYSELPYARTAARHFGTEHHEFVLEPEGTDIVDRLVEHFGEPFADSSALPTWYLSRLTRKSVTVALTGDGGDELFGGYAWYRTAQRMSRLREIVPSSLLAALARQPDRGPRLLRRAAKAAAFLSCSDGMRYARQREIVTPAVKARLYEPAFLRASGDQAYGWLAAQYDATAGSDALNRMMAADLATYMPEDLLVKVDRTSMAHALECRSPLLDRRVIAWAQAVPSRFKVTAHGGKQLLKAAVRDRFPAGFLDRRKQGFTVPLERWFSADLRTVLQERLLDGPVSRLGRLRMGSVRQLVDEHWSGRANHAALMWALLVLSTWCARRPESEGRSCE
jgi:asparagine synthase (glutamine-hydrolysing)